MKNVLLDFIAQYMELTSDEEEAIVSLDLFHALKKGEIILAEGQYSDKSYFVLDGCLRVYYVVDGEEKTTAFYTEMEGLTPSCVVSKSASEYFVTCVEDSILAISNTGMEAEVFEKFPRFETLCRILSDDLLVQQRASLDEFKIASPEQRYLNLVEKRPDLIQRVPQYQIASFLGITPQSLSRLRSRLNKAID